MPNTWRLIITEKQSAAINMALDEAILTLHSKDTITNTLRIYSWRNPTISLGYFQKINNEVNIKIIKNKQYDIVRRMTGGGVVFHNFETTYSLCTSKDEYSPNDPISIYKINCQSLIDALKEFNLNCQFKPINDIIVNGKKISGNAQITKNNSILQHGTILHDVDLEEMFSILTVSDEKTKQKQLKSAKERVTSIKDQTNINPTFNKMKDALIKAFENNFNIKLELTNPSKEELKLANKLVNEKYNNPIWTNKY